MFEVVKREMIVPNLHLLSVRAPEVAEQIQPGQFVIVRAFQDGERIPLSAADWDRETGVLTIIFMEVGESTGRMARLRAGDSIPTVVGPLGKATEIDTFGTVACIAGCYGVGSMYPIVRALHEKGNTVITFLEARSRYLLYWQEKYGPISKRVVMITRDGSAGYPGHVSRVREVFQDMGVKPGRLFVNGCTFLMSRVSQEMRSLEVPVIVSLNPIMIDGTGMCGVCRVTVGGKIRFACVDGPDFDGRLVDWDEFLKRRKQYVDEEAAMSQHSGCGGGH